MGRRSSTDEGSPLTPLMFQILVAVAEQDRHGYAITQEIEARTGGAFHIGAGTLYRSIKQLVDAGLMEETDEDTGHSQRRMYRITDAGRGRAATDAKVFREIAAWADEVALGDSEVAS